MLGDKIMSVKFKATAITLLVATFVVGAAMAADVSITITGKVIAKPCVPSAAMSSVDLGDIYAQDLSSPGSSSVWQPVTLELTGCPSGTTSVTAAFSGKADSTGDYYLNEGTATNLILQLEDRDTSSNIKNGATKTVSISGTTATIPLQVRALSIAGNAGQGTIQSTIDVAYTYQ